VGGGRPRDDAGAGARFGPIVTWSLGAAALTDFLQAGFAALTAKANELEREAV
jgi:hypothetical protein